MLHAFPCLSAGSGMLSMSFAVVLRDSVLPPSAAAAETAAGAAALVPFAMPFVSSGAAPARADGSGSLTSSKSRYSRSCTVQASQVGSMQQMDSPACTAHSRQQVVVHWGGREQADLAGDLRSLAAHSGAQTNSLRVSHQQRARGLNGHRWGGTKCARGGGGGWGWSRVCTPTWLRPEALVCLHPQQTYRACALHVTPGAP